MFALGETATFSRLLGEAGFEAVTIAPCTGVIRVDPAEWWDATLRSTPRTGALISRQTPEIQAEVRARYDELVEPYADGSDVVLPVAALVASAVTPSA